MSYKKVTKADVLKRIEDGRYSTQTAARRAIGKADFSEASKKACYAAVDSSSVWNKQSAKPAPMALSVFEKRLGLNLYSTRKGALRVVKCYLNDRDKSKANALVDRHDFDGHTYIFSGVNEFTPDMDAFLITVVKFSERVKHRLSDNSLSYSLFCRFNMYFKPEVVTRRIHRLTKEGRMDKRKRCTSSVTYVLPGAFEFSARVFGDRGEECVKLHPLPVRFKVPSEFITPFEEAQDEPPPKSALVRVSHIARSDSRVAVINDAAIRMLGIQFIAMAGDINKALTTLKDIAGVTDDVSIAS